MQEYIDKYGKEFLREILDIVIIDKRPFNNEEIRNLLLKHKLIKPSTKIIRCYHSSTDYAFHINIRNGRNTYILYMFIRKEELPELFKLL